MNKDDLTLVSKLIEFMDHHQTTSKSIVEQADLGSFKSQQEALHTKVTDNQTCLLKLSIAYDKLT